MTIDLLRKDGYKVYVKHKRRYYLTGPLNGEVRKTKPLSRTEANELGFTDLNLVPKGGATEITLLKNDEEVLHLETVCSKKDIYNRKRAVRILLGRVAKHL